MSDVAWQFDSNELESECVLVEADDATLKKRTIVPKDQKPWGTHYPKDKPFGSLNRSGSGTNELRLELPWDEFEIQIARSVVDSIVQLINDISAAIGKIATTQYVQAISDIEAALDALLGPVHRVIQIEWWFPIDVEPEGKQHDLAIEHATDYSATIDIRQVEFTKDGKTTAVADSQPFTWSFLEEVTIDNRTIKELSTTDRQSVTAENQHALAHAVVRQRGSKKIRVEVTSKLVLDFKGLSAQLGTLEQKVRKLVETLKPKDPSAPPAQPSPKEESTVSAAFSLISEAVLAIISKWSGTVSLEHTRLNLACVTAAKAKELRPRTGMAPGQKSKGKKARLASLFDELEPGRPLVVTAPVTMFVSDDDLGDVDAFDVPVTFRIEMLTPDDVAGVYEELAQSLVDGDGPGARSELAPTITAIDLEGGPGAGGNGRVNRERPGQREHEQSPQREPEWAS